MFKKIILTLMFCLIVSFSHAEKYYVFIDKGIKKIEKGQEAGQTDKGDVVAITPYTSQYKPTGAELARYKVAIMDLTDLEAQELLESEMHEEEVTRARKRKIDLTKVTIEQEKEIDKAKVFKEMSIKPKLVSIDISK